jgi:hypothetical protein
MFGAIFVYAFYLLTRVLVMKMNPENKYMKKLKKRFDEHNIETTLVTYFIEGNLDITIWCCIMSSKIYNKEQDKFGSTGQDRFANIVGYLYLIPLIYMPIHLFYKGRKLNKKYLAKKEANLNDQPWEDEHFEKE